MSSPNSRSIYEPKPLGWWDRVMVPKIIGTCCAQPEIAAARARVVPLAQGDVLELGCGGGLNIAHYDATKITRFCGVDPSPALLDQSRAAVQAKGMEADIRAGIGEQIPFDDASFDSVVVTFTLCSVDDQARVLAEIRRVLRPSGQALFLEHGRAPDPTPAKWQRRIEPFWKRIGGNCHLTRQVRSAYEAAGFKIIRSDSGYMPKAPKPFGWIEWGEAQV